MEIKTEEEYEAALKKLDRIFSDYKEGRKDDPVYVDTLIKAIEDYERRNHENSNE